MSRTSRVLGALLDLLLSRSAGSRSETTGSRSGPNGPGARPAARPSSRTAQEASPGRDGRTATREVDPRGIGIVTTAYTPRTDGDADPGEIVWTWVPYEENDGRGKDRPVLVVATAAKGAVLAVQLTSKEHRSFIPLGAGSWDPSGRPSWANLERVLLVQQDGMRREASSLDRRRYDLVAAALRSRYGWR